MSKKLTVVEELHRYARKNFKRRRTVIKGYRDLFQADLIEFIPYARLNRGYKYVLIAIDCFSKFVWAKPLKTKNGKEVTNAMKIILQTGLYPRNLQTDHGKEFYNKHFAKLMRKHDINHYSTYSTIKAAIVERVIRTIKHKLYKAFSFRGKYKWFDILQSTVTSYNNTKHRTIGMKPADVKPTTKLTVYDNLKIVGKNNFRIGDVVRISKHRSVFTRGFHPNWSAELFKIVKLQKTLPVTYKLEDMHSKPILGAFYEMELQKAKYPDVYLVEKILKRKLNKLYVKWWNINEKSWVDKSEIVE